MNKAREVYWSVSKIFSSADNGRNLGKLIMRKTYGLEPVKITYSRYERAWVFERLPEEIEIHEINFVPDLKFINE